MTKMRRLGMLLILISLVFIFAFASMDEDDSSQCERVVRKWAESSSNTEIEENKLNLKDLLFFLHVPRTGGRTYFHCFLRKLYVSSDECPRSYDKLRFDPRKPKCRLLSSHDDYSLMSKLSKEKTSVVTILRNPIERVFSTYEFAVEVAARFLVHPNLTSATQMSGRIARRSRGISTLDIWPWKYLVPWMREDLFARRDARKHVNITSIKSTQDPYNMQEVVMPLEVFIDDPVAHEIIHNGATFQLAGLTNNSCLPESHLVRQCVRRYPALGSYVLEIAKSRLDNMLYIGITEEHKASATIFAIMVGSQVISQSDALSSHIQEAASNKTRTNAFQNFKDDGLNQEQHSTDDEQHGDEFSSVHAETSKIMTVEKLMETYESCISSLRETQAKRHALSLQRIAPANFSKEARHQVPLHVIRKITSMNGLDMALYEHGQHLFMQQQKYLTKNIQTNLEGQQWRLPSQFERQLTSDNLYDFITWKVISLPLMALLLIFVFVIVTTRRRTLKVKV
ncbi:Protein-tyrosine sulfotransferase [Apostasia shenzhenica]|uniref:Protein-tyrosine sulfotransferase n=1 Tax=Apostasia shenzhenica TaxID=1088818 RepID=A0A2I0AUN1_9ASPA|nr:Protein-tyrosine sulfotransferase [Apostasia shenzhenica]